MLKILPCLNQQNVQDYCNTFLCTCCFPVTDDMRWVKIPATGDIPGGRASHSSAVFQDHLYIFGGIGPDGTLDTTYKYHTGREAALRGARGDARQLGNLLKSWAFPWS